MKSSRRPSTSPDAAEHLCRTCGRLRATEAGGECPACVARRDPPAPAALYRTFPTHSLQALYIAFALDRLDAPTPYKTRFCTDRMTAIQAELDRRGAEVPPAVPPSDWSVH
jgi:hypothetical protein